jgi:hypothetical protein
MNRNLTTFTKLTLIVGLFCCCLPFWSNATNPILPKPPVVKHSRTYVEFSIVNDTNEDYPFFLGGPNLIARGTTRTFNYPEGTDVFHLINEAEKGKEWFTVNPDMQRQTYTLSQFLRDNS